MKTTILIVLSLLSFNVFGQPDLIGQTQDFILKKFQYDPEFSVSVDTINDEKILITCRTSDTYPYYTYEISILTDRCVAYGFISRNRDILKSQIDMLDYLGKIVKADSSFTNFMYEIELPEKKVLYTIRQPFAGSQIKTRRDLYYILVEEKKKVKNHD